MRFNSINSTIKDDTVEGRPRNGHFWRCFRPLARCRQSCRHVMCTKGHGRQGLLAPVLRVGRAWCLCPLIGGCLIYTVAAAGPHHYSPSITLPGGREPFLAPPLTVLLPWVSINIDHHDLWLTILPRSQATPLIWGLAFPTVEALKVK
jgi:hypothetical protein